MIKLVGTVFTPVRKLKRAEVCISDDKIVRVGAYEPSTDGEYDVRILPDEYSIAPGLIDLHTHGGGGSDFMDGTKHAFLTAAEMHARHGATCIIPTTLCCPDDELAPMKEAFHQAKKENARGASMPGLHLEGPYLSPAQAGAQDPEYLKIPTPEHAARVLELMGSDILRMSAAPELPGGMALGRALRARGVLAAIAHSDMTDMQAWEAYENGYTHLTHLYSGMSALRRVRSYRYPGLIESAYLKDLFTAEIIADGCHLPESILFNVYRALGPARVALITDSMRAAGMGEGESVLGSLKNGRPCVVEDGVAKLPDRSAFAGSVATMDRLVRTAVSSGVPLWDALRMASLTPARIMGFRTKGCLAPEMDADVCVLNDKIENVLTVVGGRVVYSE